MESSPLKACPRCGEPRILAPECPRCGVLYAKAQPRPVPAPPPAAVGAPAAAALPVYDPGQSLSKNLSRSLEHEAAVAEWRLRLFALPGLLVGLWVLHAALGNSFVFALFGMLLHELGHAVCAWFSGHPATPSLWVTYTGGRSTFFIGLMTFALTGLVLRGVLTRRDWMRNLGLAGLALQFCCSVLQRTGSPWPLRTFGGDGGSMVFGALLMLSLYAPRESALRRGQLHWGLAVIGGASLVETFRDWWACRTNLDRIPFGLIEGVGTSDPTRLVNDFGWSELELVHRYNALGLVCFALLALAYGLGLWRARAWRPLPGGVQAP
ncbi:hypothetical protein [Archangium primigenium]|uniref:hypothetical protein n=1 Tax=[Archangium] primigenium TaxID=2792470 RepID=UPI00195ABF7D|nr:hypothetical protein [Archangium primigenium]MBM7114563.1 hypothetical protein [Archangium primigenium]